jgi:toxin CcdB
VARFDVYRNPNRRSRERVPCLLDIQADLLSGLTTRLVVPLVPATEFGQPVEKLNPVFRIGSRAHVMATSEMAAIPTKSIGERVATLEQHSAEILAAVDFLISGF